MTETERIENKTSLTEWREVVESVAAFASASGGTVRVGIAPNGKRVGVSVGKNIGVIGSGVLAGVDPKGEQAASSDSNVAATSKSLFICGLIVRCDDDPSHSFGSLRLIHSRLLTTSTPLVAML